jgi:hypothetical protein
MTKSCADCAWWDNEEVYSWLGTCKCPKPWWANGNPEVWDDAGEDCPAFSPREEKDQDD